MKTGKPCEAYKKSINFSIMQEITFFYVIVNFVTKKINPNEYWPKASFSRSFSILYHCELCNRKIQTNTYTNLSLFIYYSLFIIVNFVTKKSKQILIQIIIFKSFIIIANFVTEEPKQIWIKSTIFEIMKTIFRIVNPSY